MIKTKPLYLSLIGLLVSIFISFLILFKQESGFPDGYISPYGRFYNEYLFLIFSGINILFILLFVVSFFLKRKVKWLLYLYFIICIIMFVCNHYFYATMDHGQGG